MMSPRECKEKLQELHAIVIVPTYNNVRTLGTLMADLIQYASDILVVDDGCTDATQAVLSTFGFRSVGDNPEAGIGGRTCLRHDTNKISIIDKENVIEFPLKNKKEVANV